MRATLAAVAPGTELREGLERVLRGRTGALVVLGNDKTVESICTGGFLLDIAFTATGFRELAKMDGAIVCDRDAARILRAGVHLMPDASIATDEAGTRHRTADRVARQTGLPVISVSQSMHIIALYVGEDRYVLENAGAILGPGQPGAGHAGALQAPPRRGVRHPVRAGDRGPGHRARRRLGGTAPRDGAAHRQGDRGLRARARHRRPAAEPAAGRAGGRRGQRPRPGDPGLPAERPARPARPRRRWPTWRRCPRRTCSSSARWPGRSVSAARRASTPR